MTKEDKNKLAKLMQELAKLQIRQEEVEEEIRKLVLKYVESDYKL